jgi:hypothetical protein
VVKGNLREPEPEARMGMRRMPRSTPALGRLAAGTPGGESWGLLLNWRSGGAAPTLYADSGREELLASGRGVIPQQWFLQIGLDRLRRRVYIMTSRS